MPRRSRAGHGRRQRRRFGLGRLKIPLLLVGFFAALATSPQIADFGLGLGVKADGCRVLQVIDGDTVDLFCPGHGALRARLMDFDAPEIFSPQCPAELRRGMEATWALRTALWGAETLEVTLHGTDRYDRSLARMKIDGEPVAGRLIAQGLARPYGGGTRQNWCM